MVCLHGASWLAVSSIRRGCSRFMRRRVVLCAGIALLLSACSPDTSLLDDPNVFLPDDPGAATGDGGSSTRTSGAAPSCRMDTDCKGGERCTRGGCVTICETESDCSRDRFCEAGICRKRQCSANGDCRGGEKCAGGLCVSIGCTPDCSGRSCGSDGCKGFCGHCFDNTFCGPSLSCEVKRNCSDECAEDTSICVDVTAMRRCARGANGCTALGPPETCAAGMECQNNRCTPRDAPDFCVERECGPDGRGGVCGQCPKRMACNGDGRCVDACAGECRLGDQSCDGADRLRVCAGNADGCLIMKSEPCPPGTTCAGNQCVNNCTPESDGDICARLGRNCGPVTANDNCGASRTANCGNCNWMERTSSASPTVRAYPGMAYDSRRQRIVLFGGTNGMGGYFDDTLEWDGNNWTRRTPSASPTVRAYPGMVYDSQRQRMVLFGGRDDGVQFGDTWEWDGNNWMQRTPSASPSKRGGHSMAYDSRRQRVVLFGGRDGGVQFGDTWEWDGNNWMQRTPSASPSKRGDHAMAYDSRRQRVVLFGGYGNSDLGDTWEWDGDNWTLRTPLTSPSRRRDHAMAYDSRRQRIVLFGGWDGSGDYLADTWEWDGINWTLRTPSSSPSRRGRHAMAYDSQRQRVVLFGGHDGSNFLGDTWEWDGGP
ncbi:MAG: hypothetical protein GMKNLPBB_02191 [Myxococcota bacterium]|nr:hypothetical protein [Myxococcota bacterium]